ncbi:MAG: MBOAT family protein [Bacteroidaceae bacterium]|nr:MBOAT family protein [Bacteroidaceae bacterium]
MLFNSLQFLIFFPCICLVYWTLDHILPQRYRLTVCNLMLLAASYYFYMCWQPTYALLLLASTAITYLAALAIASADDKDRKKGFLTVSIVLNLAILFFFKYFNFAAESVTTLLTSTGVKMDVPGLNVLLPVGISFYIFQALGYSIDVYRGQIQAERNFFTYALFVSFFPQLVAGPIERSTNLLNQFKERHRFDYDFAMSGFKLMLWGYLMKICMADRAAVYVDKVFDNLSNPEGYSTLLASLLFTIQIYGDFAGYTFIAIGCGRILGFSLNDNFRRPYFAVSITDFWRRWHISLSTWFRDYVYFPLGGSKTTKAKTYRNLLITFGISGLWHGANWTFVLWGFIHGVVQCIERALGYNKKIWHSWQKALHILITLFIVNITWVLFRAKDIGEAITAIRLMFVPSFPSLLTRDKFCILVVCIVGTIVFIKETIDERKTNIAILNNKFVSNYLWPIFLLVCIGMFGMIEGGQFIYFQF